MSPSLTLRPVGLRARLPATSGASARPGNPLRCLRPLYRRTISRALFGSVGARARQDIAFHRPGPSPPPAARESPALARTGEEGPHDHLDAMNTGHAGAFWFESSLVPQLKLTMKGGETGDKVESCLANLTTSSKRFDHRTSPLG